MKGMNTQERLDDIRRICGFSEDIIRAVLKAERESILNSLKRGERATMIGRCVIRPEMKQRIAIGNQSDGVKTVNTVKLSIEVSPSLSSEMAEVREFETPDVPDGTDLTSSLRYDNNAVIWCDQIPSLV